MCQLDPLIETVLDAHRLKQVSSYSVLNAFSLCYQIRPLYVSRMEKTRREL